VARYDDPENTDDDTIALYELHSLFTDIPWHQNHRREIMSHTHTSMAPKRWLSAAILLIAASAFAQSNFDADAYYQFLESNLDMEFSELQSMYPPATQYWTEYGSGTDLYEYEYLDSIQLKFDLTGDELSALEQRHFVVSERLKYGSMGDAYLDIFRKDIPVFVSTDAIIHALHRSYDEVLKTVEISYLYPQLSTFLAEMNNSYGQLSQNYQADPDLSPALGDVDLYLTMASSLFAGELQSPNILPASAVQPYWNAVLAEDWTALPLFTSVNRLLDFSQFTVRGHYTDSEELSRYFQAMMWLGRMDFLLTQPPDSLPEADILRMYIGSVMLNELLELSGQNNTLNDMDEVIRFLVGESDNLTVAELDEIISAQGLANAGALLDEDIYTAFRAAVENSPYSAQNILSSIFIYSPRDEPPPLPVSYRLFGQRFVIDSYVFSRVVFPWIRYQNINVWRPMPNPLDVAFALGNDDALPLLAEELEVYHYSMNLAATRYLVDAYDDDFWSQSLYNVWLTSLRALNPPDTDMDLPFFMRTTAWHQQKLNTQLSSWSQLRHDNLLYAKQSYTGGDACYYPHGYVEPYPDFFAGIGQFAAEASLYFASLLPQADSSLTEIVSFYARMESIIDTLTTLAQKELEGTLYDANEEDFMRRLLTSDWSPNNSGRPGFEANGWYRELFFGRGEEFAASQLTFGEDYIVADVHTQPTDASGMMVGNVLHVGIGPINLGIYLVDHEQDTCVGRAYVGPMLSYYEHMTSDFERLTDEDWAGMVATGDLPERPDWVNIYLTDSTGAQRPEGRELPGTIYYTSIDGQSGAVPRWFVLRQNQPNPFNPTTTISYDLPEQSDVTLIIYDMRGREVTTLQKQKKPAGHYEIQWSGADALGNQISTGIYFARLQAGDFSKTIKMVYLK
jgi:hypothetical protein